MQNIEKAPTPVVCSIEDADEPRSACAIEPRGGTSLFDRQLAAVGLDDIAERIAAGTFLELDNVVRLSRASLPLLGRIVQLRPLSESCTFDNSDIPVERVATAIDMPRQIAQPLTEWDAYCRRLIALRGELAASSELAAWYPQVNRTPDENASSDDDYTGVEVLRAIALGASYCRRTFRSSRRSPRLAKSWPKWHWTSARRISDT